MGRAVKINITIPEEELGKIDKYTKEQGTTRSGLFLESVRSFLQTKDEETAERVRRLIMQRASSDIRKLRAKAGDWDGVHEIRKWRDATLKSM